LDPSPSQNQPLALALERCLLPNVLLAGRLRQDIFDLTEHLLEMVFCQSRGHVSSYSSVLLIQHFFDFIARTRFLSSNCF
jgi:hypothetical protein